MSSLGILRSCCQKRQDGRALSWTSLLGSARWGHWAVKILALKPIFTLSKALSHPAPSRVALLNGVSSFVIRPIYWVFITLPGTEFLKLAEYPTY